jgi:asparagine N-glycosylation enzyme membrane subunit Stt3
MLARVLLLQLAMVLLQRLLLRHEGCVQQSAWGGHSRVSLWLRVLACPSWMRLRASALALVALLLVYWTWGPWPQMLAGQQR